MLLFSFHALRQAPLPLARCIFFFFFPDATAEVSSPVRATPPFPATPLKYPVQAAFVVYHNSTPPQMRAPSYTGPLKLPTTHCALLLNSIIKKTYGDGGEGGTAGGGLGGGEGHHGSTLGGRGGDRAGAERLGLADEGRAGHDGGSSGGDGSHCYVVVLWWCRRRGVCAIMMRDTASSARSEGFLPLLVVTIFLLPAKKKGKFCPESI